MGAQSRWGEQRRCEIAELGNHWEPWCFGGCLAGLHLHHHLHHHLDLDVHHHFHLHLHLHSLPCPWSELAMRWVAGRSKTPTNGSPLLRRQQGFGQLYAGLSRWRWARIRLQHGEPVSTGMLPSAQGPSAPASSTCPNHRALWETLVHLQELLTLDVPGLKRRF